MTIETEERKKVVVRAGMGTMRSRKGTTNEVNTRVPSMALKTVTTDNSLPEASCALLEPPLCSQCRCFSHFSHSDACLLTLIEMHDCV